MHGGCHAVFGAMHCSLLLPCLHILPLLAVLSHRARHVIHGSQPQAALQSCAYGRGRASCTALAKLCRGCCLCWHGSPTGVTCTLLVSLHRGTRGSPCLRAMACSMADLMSARAVCPSCAACNLEAPAEGALLSGHWHTACTLPVFCWACMACHQLQSDSPQCPTMYALQIP